MSPVPRRHRSSPQTTRSRRLLSHIGSSSGDSGEHFAAVDDDTGLTTTLLTIRTESWERLGRPKRITLTIEPGDLLNGEPT